MKKTIHLLGACTLATTIYAISLAWPSSPPTLIGFSSMSDAVILKFDSVADISYTIHASVPESLSPDDLLTSPADNIVRGDEITIPLPRDEPDDTEYSIAVRFGDSSLELVRQSEQWLKNKFDFDKPGGYTILGRRDIDTPFGLETESSRVEFVGKSGISAKPMGDSPYLAVRKATGLLHYLWGQPVKQGPTSLPYNEFLQKPMASKLQIIRDGDFAVMCAGFRDLFLHAAANKTSLKVRAVAAMNYSPPMNGLLSYSHATTEIWIPELKRWVIFDPWMGIMVTMNGEPIGAMDIQKNYDRADEMQIVPVIDEIPRFHQNGDGTVKRTTFIPASVDMTKFSCNELGCSPGYREYFQRVSTSEMQSLVVDSWTNFNEAN